MDKHSIDTCLILFKKKKYLNSLASFLVANLIKKYCLFVYDLKLIKKKGS